MGAKQIFPGLYQISLGFVNVWLLDDGELTLIDAGMTNSAVRIMQALLKLGKQPGDLRRILITHLHMDHTGGLVPMLKLFEMLRVNAPEVWMSEADAAVYRQGQSMRPVQPAPGRLNRLVHAATGMGRPRQAKTPPIPLPDMRELRGGETLDFAGGLKVISAPGHTAGHTVFLWPQHGGVLLLGDAASRMFGSLSWSFIYEDFEEGRRTLQRLGGLSFETVCFSHGAPLMHGAAEKIRDLAAKVI